jgi:mRNA interferase RelE/StbE
MPYQILIHKKAQDFIDKQQEKIKKQILATIRELVVDPYTPRPKADIKKLSGTKGREDAYRIRTGDYRLVYAIENKKVYITIIFHRGKEYQEL